MMDQKPENPSTNNNSTSQQLEHIANTLNCIKKLTEQLCDNNEKVNVLSEVRINEELERLRREYQTGLNILSHTKETRWKIITICSGVFCTFISLFAVFVAPQQILKPYVTRYIDTNLTEKKLQEAADRIAKDKMELFVTGKLKPLNSEIGTLTAYIGNLKQDISKKQKRINSKQIILNKLLEIQQLTISCKAGTTDTDSYANYIKLKKISGQKSSFQPFANAALRDIFFYFDAEKNTEGRLLVDPISNRNIDFSVDEVIGIYYSDTRDMQESAVNTLAKLNRETAIQELCDSLDRQKNLRVISRIIRTLGILTGKNFETLDIDAVNKWWLENRNKEKYKPCYKGYLEAISYMKNKTPSNVEEYNHVISLLGKTIEMDPDALHARCLRGEYLALLEKFSDSEKEFKEVEKRNNNYRRLFYYRAVLFVKQNNTPGAIESLNQAISISPGMEMAIKTELIFKNLLPQLKWPNESN